MMGRTERKSFWQCGLSGSMAWMTFSTTSWSSSSIFNWVKRRGIRLQKPCSTIIFSVSKLLYWLNFVSEFLLSRASSGLNSFRIIDISHKITNAQVRLRSHFRLPDSGSESCCSWRCWASILLSVMISLSKVMIFSCSFCNSLESVWNSWEKAEIHPSSKKSFLSVREMTNNTYEHRVLEPELAWMNPKLPGESVRVLHPLPGLRFEPANYFGKPNLQIRSYWSTAVLPQLLIEFRFIPIRNAAALRRPLSVEFREGRTVTRNPSILAKSMALSYWWT